jgi:hypothetical protein
VVDVVAVVLVVDDDVDVDVVVTVLHNKRHTEHALK